MELTPQQKQREAIKANIVGCYNTPEKFLAKSNSAEAFEELIKGDISNNFSYRDSIEVIKKGKEIKPKLEAQLVLRQGEYETLQQQLTQLAIEVGIQPNEVQNTDWYDVKIDYTPTRYGWDAIDKLQEGERQQARKYNEVTEKIINNQIEQKMLRAMSNNLNDERDYPLSIKQIIALNF